MKSEFVFALETAGWPVLVITPSGVIWRANAAAAELFSAVTETGRLSAASIWSPENDSTVEVFLSRAQTTTQEAVPLKLRTKNGQTVQFSAYLAAFNKDGQKHFLLQLLKPASARPKTASPPEADSARASQEPRRPTPETGESNIAHKQKLEFALQLARSVALDFNNALTSILGYTSLILSRTELDNPWRPALLEMEKSAEKAAEVAADLAAFSRQDKDTPSQVAGNLNDLVRRTVELSQSTSPDTISWALELEPKLYTVNFDEAKVQQAFVKIIDNALQALPEEGRVAVRTRNQDVEQDVEDGRVHLPAGSYVCIEFEDTGCGIEPDVLPRIFEPFFTTKPTGHRGLGLAWVYGIVTNHGGRVAVSSQPGQGTLVRVYLPAQKKIVLDRALAADDLGGTETILLVDDEDLLLTMGSTVLSSFGYRVLTANSGRKALELFRDHAPEISLVITDLVMPQMSGRELIQELRRQSPSVKVICSTGYAGALNSDTEESSLQKPFTSVDLLRTVKRALAETKAS
ncbi:MAG: ATP-binding protein [Verrucomicrobiia bacterium]